jgi:hypothetical protein
LPNPDSGRQWQEITTLNIVEKCNEDNLQTLPKAIGGQVLVPAAAVIPAPKAYIKVVAVKKLVVEVLAVLGLCTWCEGTSSHPLANTNLP